MQPKAEYGGYLELDEALGELYHPNAMAINSARNCLAYLIQTKRIQKLYLPYFLCATVENTCHKLNIPVSYYSIDEYFHPQFNATLKSGEWLYFVNFYGQFQNEDIEKIVQQYGNVIVDNVQAFFQKAIPNVPTIYTCRKFFGVPDGAYLYTDDTSLPLEQDYSYDRMRFILGRFEKTAGEFYAEFQENEKWIDDMPLRHMSKLTEHLMRSVSYETIQARRTENFAALHNALKNLNQLELTVPEGAYMYPLWIPNGAKIRKQLQAVKIFIPTLWPDVYTVCHQNQLEYNFAENILPIPVDQRYTKEDMLYLSGVVQDYISKDSKS